MLCGEPSNWPASSSLTRTVAALVSVFESLQKKSSANKGSGAIGGTSRPVLLERKSRNHALCGSFKLGLEGRRGTPRNWTHFYFFCKTKPIFLFYISSLTSRRYWLVAIDDRERADDDQYSFRQRKAVSAVLWAARIRIRLRAVFLFRHARP